MMERFRFDAMSNQIESWNADQKLVFASAHNVQAQRRVVRWLPRQSDAKNRYSPLEGADASWFADDKTLHTDD